MKRILTFLLCLTMVLSVFAGCSQQADTDKGGEAIQGSEPSGWHEPAQLQDTLRPEQKQELLASRGDTTNAKKPYTVMIYMVGSNLESTWGLATGDLLEMLDSQVDISKVNVVVYTGGAYAWDYPIPSDCNAILAMNADHSKFEVVSMNKQAVSTGDPQVLYDFMNFCHKNYPADEYGLIFWNHGLGSVYGFGADELFDDELYLVELEAALAASPFAQEKLALVGFDACLMATVETAATFAPYAKYMLASEELEPGCGWDYSCLSVLNNGDFTDLAKKALTTYEAAVKALRTNDDYTLSLLDLSETNQVLTAMDNLFTAAASGVANGDFTTISQARIKTLMLGLNGSTDYEGSIDQVDLGHAAENLKGLYQTEATGLQNAISQMVVKQVTNVKGTSGLSVYYPHYNQGMYTYLGGLDLYHQTAGSQGYIRYLDVYTDMLLDGNLDTQWAQELQTQSQPTHLALEFTDAQLKTVGRIYYNLMQLSEDAEYYLPVLTECAVEPAGQVLIPMDPEVVLINSDIAARPQIFHVSQLGSERYVSQLAVLMASNDVLTGKVEPIHISMSRNEDKLDITGIVARDENADFHVRCSMPVDYWNYIGHYTYGVKPTMQDDVLLPYEQWERQDGFYLPGIYYQNDFWFEFGKLSDFPGQYAMQIVVEDVTGQVIMSAWEELPATKVTQTTVATENGMMTFYVYEDHAELALYEGTDTMLEIPAQVDGMDVTVIGPEAVVNVSTLTQIVLPDTVVSLEERAFSNTPIETILFSRSLTHIGAFALSGYTGATLELPETVTYIGSKAFSGARMETVVLPAGVQYVAGDAFNFCSKLKSIEIPDGLYYKSVDGVLFTQDGKTLVAAPCSLQEYTVPEGVVTIGYGAFSGNWNLSKLVLPEGLKTIESLAFAYCESIADLTLPESLEFIGESAFCTNIGMPKSATTTTIFIGKNVYHIGIDAFSAFQVESYEVDAENLYYSSVDGCLLNASGTTLMNVPYAQSGTFEIPFGVCYLDWHCLEDCDGITELILPDTVAAINLGAGLPGGLQKLVVGAGLVYWGNKTECETVPEIVISEENPNF